MDAYIRKLLKKEQSEFWLVCGADTVSDDHKLLNRKKMSPRKWNLKYHK